MQVLYPLAVFLRSNGCSANAAAEIDLGQVDCVVIGQHQVYMSIGEGPPEHDLLAESDLFLQEFPADGFSSTVQIIPEIIGVETLVGLDIVAKNNNANIPAIGDKWLQDKRKGQNIIGCQGKDILRVFKEMDPQSAILPVMFQDDLPGCCPFILVYDIQKTMDIINGRCSGEHHGRKDSCLKDLRPAGKLGGCGRDEGDSPLHKVKKKMFFLGFQTETATDDITSLQLMHTGKQGLIIPYDSWGVGHVRRPFQ